MSREPNPHGRKMAFIATLLIVLSYVFSLLVAFTHSAVLLTVLIPGALGCLALGALIWVMAVLREVKDKGVL